MKLFTYVKSWRKPKIDLERLKALIKREQEFSKKWMDDSAADVQQEIYSLVPDLIELLEQAKEIMQDVKDSYHGGDFPSLPEDDIKEWQSRLKKEGEK